jgi:cell division septation protein DedD
VYVVSFAAVLTEQKAKETAATISVHGMRPSVVPSQSGSTTIYRVVLGPYSSRDEAERIGRDSQRPFWIYEESR